MLAFAVFFLGTAAAGAQAHGPAKAQPTLEAATVRWLCQKTPSGGCDPRLIAPPQYDPARFTCNFCSLASMVGWAYGVNGNQFKGMPMWAYSEVYRTVIAASAPATLAQMKQYMRTILANAFDLKCRVEEKPTPVYRLEQGTVKPKFLPGGKAANETKADFMAGVREFDTVQQLVTYLNSLHYEGSPGVPHPVEDGTGMTGQFDIVLKLGPARSMSSADMMALVREQLGLKVVVVPGKATYLHIDEVMPRRTAWTKG